jgi:hypothetical protein
MELISVTPVQSEIKYKQINCEDFRDNGYTVTKDTITPTSEGYISDQIKSAFHFDEKSTVVINAGVGQGKTFTVMEIAKQYFESGFLLVFAVPYKSLIDQYRTELLGLNIEDANIFDYRNLLEAGEDNSGTHQLSQVGYGSYSEETAKIPPALASQKNIHLVTINCLLGNPGEDFLEQSRAKTEYIHCIIDRCKSENKKVLLIMDEIHDGIHNFKQNFVFNLWKWKSLLHKILVVSATYNEAAKIVIKYLAELTNNTIQIIESARTKIEEKQSDLFLLLYNKPHYYVESSELVSVFEDLISGGKKINVLSYSKSISEDIVNREKKIGALLHAQYGQEGINLCTGDSDNIFDPHKCNIGTTFSTGINIRGNDSAFIVLLPSPYSVSNRRAGIFSRGINTLIQALARVRDKSEIYIIMPAPEYLISYESATGINYTDKVTSISFFSQHRVRDKYFEINSQRELIEITYNKIKEPLYEIIEEIDGLKESRINKPSLYFPTLDDYILSSGEQVLYSKYDIFGKDLSVYTFWAAFNDQFLNCRLKAISILNILQFNKDSVLNQLKDFVYNQFFDFQNRPELVYGMFNYFGMLSDREFYDVLRQIIFKNSVQLLTTQSDGTIKTEILQPFRNSTFERKILALVQLVKKPYSNISRKFYSESSLGAGIESVLQNEMVLIEAPLSEADYLLACFSHSQRTEFPENISAATIELMSNYKALAAFLEIFESRFVYVDSSGKKYFESNVDFTRITEGELEAVYNAVRFIRRNDPIIQNSVVSFMQALPDTFAPNQMQVLNIIYRAFKKNFYKTKRGRVNLNESENRKDVIEDTFTIPYFSDCINVLFMTQDAYIENVQSSTRSDQYAESHHI